MKSLLIIMSKSFKDMTLMELDSLIQ